MRPPPPIPLDETEPPAVAPTSVRRTRPNATPLFLINSCEFIALTTWITLRFAAYRVDPQFPGAIILGQVGTPLFAFLTAAQAIATFARSTIAARTTAVLSFSLATPLTLMCGHALLSDPDPHLLGPTAFTAYLIFTGALNLRWVDELQKPLPTGLCPTCHYDLRATPDRCPECGTIPPAATAPPT